MQNEHLLQIVITEFQTLTKSLLQNQKAAVIRILQKRELLPPPQNNSITNTEISNLVDSLLPTSLDSTLGATILACTAELKALQSYDRKAKQNMLNQTLHTSNLNLLRRKASEYQALIDKLQSKIQDAKSTVLADSTKTTKTQKELNRLIDAEANITADMTPDEKYSAYLAAKDTVLQNYSADATNKLHDKFSALYTETTKQIEILKKQKEDILKMIAPQTSNPQSMIPPPSSTKSLNPHHSKELKTKIDATLTNL